MNNQKTSIRFLNVIIIFIITLLFLPQSAFSQFFKVDTTKKVDQLMNNFFLKVENSGIKIKNIKYTGEKVSLGYFVYSSDFKVLPSTGIILSTGNVIEAEGPNKKNASTENYSNGDADIELIVNNQSFDAAIIEFDFMSLTDSIAFSFVFASEEYPEYVRKGVSDAFAFLVKDYDTGRKINLARLPESNIPITVDLINNENNTRYFVNNVHINFASKNHSRKEFLFYTENNHLFEFDGFTRLIETGLRLKPYRLYHFKVVIADVGDRKYDSWVLLKGNSFSSCGSIHNPSSNEIYEYLNQFAEDTLEINDIHDKIRLIVPIYFDFDSDIIKSSSYSIIDHIITILQNSGYNLVINGYADKKGEKEYNQKLSQQRADNVKNYLILKGIAENRIISYGKGILDLTEDDLSRKVEFVFLK